MKTISFSQRMSTFQQHGYSATSSGIFIWDPFLFAVLSFFALANNLLESENDEIPPPPLFLATVMNTFLILLPLLALFNQRNYALIGRLFPHFRGIRNHGRDVWAVLERNPHIFWYCTGETPESLETVVENIFADVTSPRHLPRVPTSNRRRRCLLDVRNRVLLGFIWLRQYLKIHVLAYIFGISKSTVAEEIYHIVPILYVRYRHYISWHGLNQWRDFLRVNVCKNQTKSRNSGKSVKIQNRSNLSWW